jgi:hypothetical protein
MATKPKKRISLRLYEDDETHKIIIAGLKRFERKKRRGWQAEIFETALVEYFEKRSLTTPVPENKADPEESPVVEPVPEEPPVVEPVPEEPPVVEPVPEEPPVVEPVPKEPPVVEPVPEEPPVVEPEMGRATKRVKIKPPNDDEFNTLCQNINF